jgi:hypothetical protein
LGGGKPYGDGYPKRELEAEAMALFAEEKGSGTEFVAILGHLEDWQYGAEERLRQIVTLMTDLLEAIPEVTGVDVALSVVKIGVTYDERLAQPPEFVAL